MNFNTRLEAGFFHFGAVTLCRFLGGLGDLGWKWVDIGGQGVGVWLRYAGRGLQESGDLVIGKPKTLPRINAD